MSTKLDAMVDVVLAYKPPKRIKPRKKKSRNTTRKKNIEKVQ
jgi:hypothetical protein